MFKYVADLGSLWTVFSARATAVGQSLDNVRCEDAGPRYPIGLVGLLCLANWRKSLAQSERCSAAFPPAEPCHSLQAPSSPDSRGPSLDDPRLPQPGEPARRTGKSGPCNPEGRVLRLQREGFLEIGPCFTGTAERVIEARSNHVALCRPLVDFRLSCQPTQGVPCATARRGTWRLPEAEARSGC